MKLIIAGSRKLDVPLEFIGWCIAQSPFEDIEEFVSGMASGIDESGWEWAYYIETPCKEFPAKWTDLSNPDAVIKKNRYGKYDAIAGHRRNKKMAEYADGLLLIWDGKSDGSRNMKEQMIKLNKPIYEVILKV